MSEYVWRDSREKDGKVLESLDCGLCVHCRANDTKWICRAGQTLGRHSHEGPACELFTWDGTYFEAGPGVRQLADIAILEMATEDTDE